MPIKNTAADEKSPLNNTEKFCLQALAEHGPSTPEAIAKRRWPSSRQLHLKAGTIAKYLRRLESYVLVGRSLEGVWFATPTGLEAARGRQQAVGRGQ